MADRVYPLVRRIFPDGEVVWEEKGKLGDVLAALRSYDPGYYVRRNREANRWEVWRENEGGNHSRSLIYEGDRLPEPGQVTDDLFRQDMRKGYDPLAEYDRAEARRLKTEDDALLEIGMRNADRMHYELVDELSAHMPAARPMYLGPSGHRRRRSA